jgi:UDP-glucose 4-epimerase
VESQERIGDMSVLVTGGAGYIGAHMLLALEDAGERAVALDNLRTGARWLAPESAAFVEADVGDEAALGRVFAEHEISEVIHFAGSILVPESILHPLDYYRNNTANTLNLLSACVNAGVKRFIFSSTASVYGVPERTPVSESSPIHSITPYGASMAMSERILEDAAAAHGLSFVTLRYFNVAGADPKTRAGEIGKPTHLIKAAAQIALGIRKEKLQIHGGDYSTPDGSAIRDYVHVSDLAQAHLAALERLRRKGGTITLNCGYGRGYSVYEVVEAFRRVSGKPMEYEVGPRRAGDPAQLIADNAAIRTVLDWRPRYDDLDFIVETALDWERRLSDRQDAA